jgi:hypothetical protein
MAEQPNDVDALQERRDYEQIIAEGLWAIRPQDRVWNRISYTRVETGTTAGSIVTIQGEEEDERLFPARDVKDAARKLRAVMYTPGKGTWLSMNVTITPAGNGWESEYNYDKKPVWELGEPSANAYAQELYLFPRDEEHIPDWFKEELKDATWTPPNN